MRQAYYGGATGLFVSGTVWLIAGLVTLYESPRTAVITLLVGGMFIFPVSVVFDRLLGRSGKHAPGNQLGTAAGEGTIFFILAIAPAFAISFYRIEWFFPAMLLLIGGRYFTFNTFYGMRVYWLCGAALAGSGIALAMHEAPVPAGAFAGGAIEYLFGVAVAWQIHRESRGERVN